MRRLAAEYPADFRYAETGGRRPLGEPPPRQRRGLHPRRSARRSRAARLSSSAARSSRTWSCWTSARATCGPTRAWSRSPPAGRSRSSSAARSRRSTARCPARTPTASSPAPRRSCCACRRAQAYRRVNWAFQPLRVLDHSMDAAAAWMPEAARFLATATEAGHRRARVPARRAAAPHPPGNLRRRAVPHRHPLRCPWPTSRRVPAWAARVLAVLTDLPDDIADYKGLRDLRPRVIDCLRRLTE